jgi:LmbE family N-acetylglucosaminyl deacetylase
MMPTRAATVTTAVTAAAVCALGAVLLGSTAAPLEFRPPLGPGTRLLVFAPHPDDEALGAAGLIQRVLTSGGSVRVALMTSGDAFSEGVETETHVRRPGPRDYRGYGDLRERETTAAMRILGVDRAHILFLGFPDGGLCLIASKYLSAKAVAYRSPYTGRIAPEASEQMIRGVSYRGTDIRREVESILTSYRPTLIAVPNREDRHPDHCATPIFVHEALEAVAGPAHLTPRVLRYLIHDDNWPPLDEARDEPLREPPNIPSGNGVWRTLPLTSLEAATKQRALEAYASQWLVIGKLLHAFERPNELFVEGWTMKSPPCWCDSSRVATEPRPSSHQRGAPRP